MADRRRSADLLALRPTTFPEDMTESDELLAVRGQLGDPTALGALPVAGRELPALFYLEELSFNQLADVFAVPVGTIKSRLFRARRMLRERAIRRKGRRDGDQ